jgi:hypothetical protein
MSLKHTALPILLSAVIFVSPIEAQTIPSGSIPGSSGWIDHGLVLDAPQYGKGWDALFEGYSPCTIVKKNDTFYLYYIGSDNYISQKDNIGPAHRSIGVATSKDGIRWTKYANNPIITYSPMNNPEEGAPSCGVTIDATGTFHLYFGANLSTSSTDPNVVTDIRYTTSIDGFNYSAHQKVVDHANSSIYGYGDEIHAVSALLLDNSWYVWYNPNGVTQTNTLGFVRGSQSTTLSTSSFVGSSGSPIAARGPVSVVPVGTDSIFYFTKNKTAVEVRAAPRNNPTAVGSLLQSYSFKDVNSVFYLDTATNTWYSIYNTWFYLGLRTAAYGKADATGPSIPGDLKVKYVSPTTTELSWQPSTDSETAVAAYQISRNNVVIGTTPSLQFIDSGPLAAATSYTYQLKAMNAHGTYGSSASLTTTTPADTTPPQIVAITTPSLTQISITFSEPLNRQTAETVSNYTVLNTSISQAVLSLDGKAVMLTTSPQTENAHTLITVSNIEDIAPAKNKLFGSQGFVVSSIPGLIGNFRFESDALAADSSGYAIPASVYGAPVTATGKLGSAMKLNGKTDYVEMDNTSHLDSAFSSSFTVSGWAYPTGAPPYTTTKNMSYTLFSGPNVRINYDYDRRFNCETSAAAGPVKLTSVSLPSDSWYHVAMTVNESTGTVRCYVNGQDIAGSPKTFSGTLTDLPKDESYTQGEYYSRYRIGVHDPLFDYQNDFFNGLLDDVRIYNQALTATQLTQIMNFQQPTSTLPSPTASPTSSPTPAPLAGDANNDGKVDGIDYVIWLNNYGSTNSSGPSQGDFNADTKVDGIDYVIWLNAYTG